MSKTTQLIDEIHNRLQRLQVLSSELREQYRELAATLLSAHALVPNDRWEAWLSANLNLDLPTVQTVMEGNIPALPFNTSVMALGLETSRNNETTVAVSHHQKHRNRKSV
jgi:hypothetical protein